MTLDMFRFDDDGELDNLDRMRMMMISDVAMRIIMMKRCCDVNRR